MSSNYAPITKIFEGTPPTREEAPEGYITSDCGTRFQRANALLVMGAVCIVLTPHHIEIKASPLK